MASTIFEQTGGTYTQVGDYMLPDLLPAKEENKANIGVWGMRHKRYLKQNHKVRYYNLLTSGNLNSYLADVEQQAQQLFLRLVTDFAEKENVTEKLKTNDMMLWVQKMNNIRNRAMEIVNAELIYTVSTQQRQGTIPATFIIGQLTCCKNFNLKVIYLHVFYIDH